MGHRKKKDKDWYDQECKNSMKTVGIARNTMLTNKN